MSVIKQISVYTGNSWDTTNIGANAGDIELKESNGTARNIGGSGNLLTGLRNLLPTSTLSPSKALYTNASGIITASNTVTSTHLGYLNGVTSNIQTQLNNKVNKAGDTMTGNLVIQKSSPFYYADSSAIDSKIGQTIPTSDTTIGGYDIRDKNDYVCGWCQTKKLTTDIIRTELVARRASPTNATTNIANVLYLGINKEGGRYVTVSDASIWRSALGIGYNKSPAGFIAAKNVPTGQDTTLTSFTLQPGTSIIVVTVNFASNATGRRVLFLAESNTGDNIGYDTQIVIPAASGAGTRIQLVYIPSNLSAAKTYYVRVYQASGATLSVNGYYNVLRIHD